MKLFSTALLLAVNLLMAIHVSGQERRMDFYEEGPRAHTFYVEAGGPGFISINYDTRFAQTRNGWGMRGGLGYVQLDGESVLTVPVQVNYLIGKNGHYFEIGGGASLAAVSYDDSWGYYSGYRESSTHVMGTLLFGYRKQPVNGGFNFRAGLSPILFRQDFIPYLPHISFGYSF